MDGVLVGVNVRADLNMMAFMAFKFLWIHYVPALLVGIVDEGDFVTFSFDRAFESLQWRGRSLVLAHVAALAHILRNCGHAERDTHCNYENPQLLHRTQSPF